MRRSTATPPPRLYTLSLRPYPEKLADPSYPLYDDTLLVDRSGHIRLPMSRQAFLATALAGQLVAAPNYQPSRSYSRLFRMSRR
jgi:hypothetical protein